MVERRSSLAEVRSRRGAVNTSLAPLHRSASVFGIQQPLPVSLAAFDDENLDAVSGLSVSNQTGTDAPEPNAFVVGEVFAGMPHSRSLREHLERCLDLPEHTAATSGPNAVST